MSLELWDEYRQNIENSIINAPRSLQRTIGPSELGTPCLRCLGMKLTGMAKQAETKPHMYTFVGTCVHEHMERLFTKLNHQRYLTEIGVQITYLPEVQRDGFLDKSQELLGHIDVYDAERNAIIDWKISSNDRIQTIKRHGLPQEYLVQASLYGIGINNVMKTYPKTNCVYILPRNGQSLDSAYPIEWEYTSKPGEWAILRAISIINTVNAIAATCNWETATAWINSMPACGAESGECWDCMNGTYLPAEIMAIQNQLPEVPAMYEALYDTIPSHYDGEIPDYQTLN